MARSAHSSDPVEERELLLKYGYPFEDDRIQLEKVATSADVEVLIISRFYLNQLIGDLSWSINKRTKGKTQRDLTELCDRLETVERRGDGELDVR